MYEPVARCACRGHGSTAPPSTGCPSRLHTETTMLMAKMRTAGGIINAKSQVEPTTQLTWMGKHFNGQCYTLLQSAEYMATATAMWVKLATKAYDHRTMCRLCGKLVWAMRPGQGAMPFVVGLLAWLNWGPRQSKYTPPTVLRGLMEALAIGITPWQAPPALHVTEETWYIDTAYDESAKRSKISCTYWMRITSPGKWSVR